MNNEILEIEKEEAFKDKLQGDVDNLESIADELRKKYPFLEININYDYDLDEAGEYYNSFKVDDDE